MNTESPPPDREHDPEHFTRDMEVSAIIDRLRAYAFSEPSATKPGLVRVKMDAIMEDLIVLLKVTGMEKDQFLFETEEIWDAIYVSTKRTN